MMYEEYKSIYEAAEQMSLAVVPLEKIHDLIDEFISRSKKNGGCDIKELEQFDEYCKTDGTLPFLLILELIDISEEKFAHRKVSDKKKEAIIKTYFSKLEEPDSVNWSWNMMVNIFLTARFNMFSKHTKIEVDLVKNSVMKYRLDVDKVNTTTYGLILSAMADFWIGDETFIDVLQEISSMFESKIYACPDDGKKMGTEKINNWKKEIKPYKHLNKKVKSLIDYKECFLDAFGKENVLLQHQYFEGELDDSMYAHILRFLDFTIDYNKNKTEFIVKVVLALSKDGIIPKNEDSFCIDNTPIGKINQKGLFQLSDDGKWFFPIKKESKEEKKSKPKPKEEPFELLGRKELNSFFNDSIIDVVNNLDVYSKFGISFPEPFILEGPPGCGKTYAVSKLEEYLDWPSYHITSSSVGSPYIHEAAKKIEEIFNRAKEDEMSMVIVDEMDSFMPNRENAQHSDSHVVEEVNAFLKCIQTAQEDNILVIGMTNFVKNIDPAILRSGRMGTHIKVSWPSEEEITQVFRSEMDKRPYDKTVDLSEYAHRFKERPLSDVTAVVRRASMSAARRRAKEVERTDIDTAMDFVLGQNKKEEQRVIGFC